MKTKGLMPVIEKKDKAVSPIIATILLVAITVILASTLYLALTGFFTTSTSGTPTVGISAKNVTSGTAAFKYTITISNPSSSTIAWSATTWILKVGSSTYTLTYSSTNANWSMSAINTGALTGDTVYMSAGSGNYVAGGDVLSLTITGTTTGAAATTTSAISTLSFNLVGSNGGQMGTAGL